MDLGKSYVNVRPLSVLNHYVIIRWSKPAKIRQIDEHFETSLKRTPHIKISTSLRYKFTSCTNRIFYESLQNTSL